MVVSNHIYEWFVEQHAFQLDEQQKNGTLEKEQKDKMLCEFKEKHVCMNDIDHKMTPQMFTAAASVYHRPIIVFSISHKMAYFEKEYLPLPNLAEPNSEVPKCEPLYIYSYGDIRYKLMVHRNQIQMINMLKQNKVGCWKFKLNYNRLRKHRIKVY